MKQKAIFFDLDGTLTDSGEGIINCVTLALKHFGLPIPSRESLGVFVGPPLEKTFVEFGIPEDKTDEAIAVFRSRYNTVGKFENTPYPGVHQLLQNLKDQGHRLFVATSKPEKTALEVLAKFQLTDYLEKICGATMDGSRVNKEDVITYLLAQVQDVKNVIMVGDTRYDVLGAKHHGIDTIGVSWGYGSVAEMEQAGAIAIAHTMEQLQTLLEQ